MTFSQHSDQRELDLQKWKPAEWDSLSLGDEVSLVSEAGTVEVGTVDDFTSDRSVLWLRMSQNLERRFFLSADELTVWLSA